MDHLVYLDKASIELQNLVSGNKDIILRGATGRKLPYDRCSIGDVLYLVNNNGEGLIKAKCEVSKVVFTDKLSVDESIALVDSLFDRIKLTPKALKRFRGKRYLSIIEVINIEEIQPLSFDKTAYGNMDDWLLIESINNIT